MSLDYKQHFTPWLYGENPFLEKLQGLINDGQGIAPIYIRVPVRLYFDNQYQFMSFWALIDYDFMLDRIDYFHKPMCKTPEMSERTALNLEQPDRYMHGNDMPSALVKHLTNTAKHFMTNWTQKQVQDVLSLGQRGWEDAKAITWAD